MARLLRPLAVTGAERPGLFDRVRGAACAQSKRLHLDRADLMSVTKRIRDLGYDVNFTVTA